MNQLTAAHRAQQLLLHRATVSQLVRLFPLLDWARLDATFPTFASRVAVLVQRNRSTSAGLAARYAAALRRLHRSGEFPAVFADPLPAGQLVASLHATTVAPLKAATANGRPEGDAMSSALVLASGAMSRLVLAGGRETLRLTASADPDAAGWRRVGGGQSCDFCTALLDDDVVNHPEIDFKAHDNCGCTAEVVYF